jgi:hypothetical protein
MTALAPSRPAATHRGQPSGRRLIGASLIGSLGAIAFSIAVGAAVAASKAGIAPGPAADARTLHSWLPAIVAIGVAHLVVAALLLSGRDLVRIAGVVVSGVVAIAAGAAAAMVAAGIDPFAGSAAGHPSSAGAGILGLAAVLYGAAALAAASGPTEA